MHATQTLNHPLARRGYTTTMASLLPSYGLGNKSLGIQVHSIINRPSYGNFHVRNETEPSLGSNMFDKITSHFKSKQEKLQNLDLSLKLLTVS
ncbi:hypothetical protein QL285_072054 [Trifolium repens]|jgi:hypothetical protein|nr:hypothetical protein QL285_072054 [Trifolium repens]